MKEKMKMILTKDEIARIKDGSAGEIEVDLHGLTVKNARRLLINLMVIDDEGRDICAIHGYLHGTAIKEMIIKDLANPRLTEKRGVKGNYGRTILKVRAS